MNPAPANSAISARRRATSPRNSTSTSGPWSSSGPLSIVGFIAASWPSGPAAGQRCGKIATSAVNPHTDQPSGSVSGLIWIDPEMDPATRFDTGSDQPVATGPMRRVPANPWQADQALPQPSCPGTTLTKETP